MTVAPAPTRFNRADWASAFRNVEEELSQAPVRVASGISGQTIYVDAGYCVTGM